MLFFTPMSEPPAHSASAKVETDTAKKTSLDHFVGVFALGATAIFPLAAGVCAMRCHDLFTWRIGEHIERHRLNIPEFPAFVYNHFSAFCWGLFAVTLALTFISWWQFVREKDPMIRVGRQLVLAVASAIAGLVFLSVFIIATAGALSIPRT